MLFPLVLINERLSQAFVLKIYFSIFTIFFTFSVFNLVKLTIFKIEHFHFILNVVKLSISKLDHFATYNSHGKTVYLKDR